MPLGNLRFAFGEFQRILAYYVLLCCLGSSAGVIFLWGAESSELWCLCIKTSLSEHIRQSSGSSGSAGSSVGNLGNIRRMIGNNRAMYGEHREFKVCLLVGGGPPKRFICLWNKVPIIFHIRRLRSACLENRLKM